MKKRDMTKLALMGLLTGLSVTGQISAETNAAQGTQIARGGCGNKCSGVATRDRRYNGGGEVADNTPDFQYPQHSCSTSYQPQGTTTYQPQGTTSYQPQGTTHSCSGYNQYPQASCSGYNQYPQASCSGYNQYPQASCNGYNQYPTSHSCSTASQAPRSNRPYQYQGNQLSDSSQDSPAGKSTTTFSQTMTENELLSKLNEQGKAAYNGLTAEGKILALKLASQSCKGQNDCKGLNACKTPTNSCAGQGSCKGKSPSNFSDKNLAVKVAAKKMAEKRGNMITPSGKY